MNFNSQPVLWIVALGILLAIPAVVAVCKVRGRAKRGVLATVAVLCLLLPGYLFVAVYFPQWIDARHRVYQAFYQDIEFGMSRDQVFATLGKHYPTNGPRQRPTTNTDTAERLGFFMNPEHSREPNCEGIFLDFKDGRMVRKHYSRD